MLYFLAQFLKIFLHSKNVGVEIETTKKAKKARLYKRAQGDSLCLVTRKMHNSSIMGTRNSLPVTLPIK